MSGAVAAATVLTLGAAACGSSGGHAKADAAPSKQSADSGSGGSSGKGKTGLSLDGIKLPAKLPANIQDVKSSDWKNWKNWAKQSFANKRIEGFWTPKRMAQAKENSLKLSSKDAAVGGSQTTAAPPPVGAKKAPRPYTAGSAVLGKIYGEGPEGEFVCSGTVVEDPAHPGKSNLVWTAGHCTSGGAGKGWYHNIMFVPDYNNGGKATDQTRLTNDKDLAPYGYWWANAATTSNQWFTQGDEHGGQTQYDYSLFQVVPPKGTTKSLQETVGGAMSIWFNAPHKISKITAWGYPAAPPYTGVDLYHCDGAPGDLSADPSAPADYRIGCSMTGGSSGGGWFAKKPNGSVALVSNTSIGPADAPVWLAGPRLDGAAQNMFQQFDSRIAG
ncbi:trypsin-like serine peptidase [Mangrovactinospora gilvigrisea]|uniref:trypsin-like serine peptidase n=1 Tax=Mangrovactinospora gilvigrisea TaxID=1428644 RepID=UPI001114BED4|nr:hypothetical protein [Mangrovactinospora gilvigrisea]